MYEVRKDCKNQSGACDLFGAFYYEYVLVLKTNQM